MVSESGVKGGRRHEWVFDDIVQYSESHAPPHPPPPHPGSPQTQAWHQRLIALA